ncbi:DUF6538 domain-containing protein [Devosia nitrariae]|nr:DUF6538 domain-containing protein [Devosia nitrariae]
MAQPVRHGKSGVIRFRKAVPKDLRPILGKREIKVSLGKDPALARIRNAELHLLWERNFASLRAGMVELSHKDCVALAGALYAEHVERFREEPGERWRVVAQALNNSLAAGHRGTSIIVAGRKEVTDRMLARLQNPHRAKVRKFLAKQGLTATKDSLAKAMPHVNQALSEASNQVVRFLEGDYSPDPVSARFPPWVPPRPLNNSAPVSESSRTDLLKLFDEMAGEREFSPATIKRHRPIIAQVAATHADIRTITPEWCVGWKNELIARGLSARTVQYAYLAALRNLANYAIENKKIERNPLQGISVRVKRRTRDRVERGHTNEEALIILRATLGDFGPLLPPDQHRARRWLPWLCYYSGARIGEMAQLRKQDLVQEEGVWILLVKPSAGRLKDNKARRVPLHPHLIAQGFVDVVRKLPEGYIFTDPGRRRSRAGSPLMHKKTAENIGRWVRGLGLADQELQPSHGWRHRFKTLARLYQLDPGARDYIQGHSPHNDAEDYGDQPAQALFEQISRIPAMEVGGNELVLARLQRPPRTATSKA